MSKHRNQFGVQVPVELRKVHAKHEARCRLAKWNYCKVDDNGQVEEVSCKHCGAVIMGPRDFGDPEVYRAKDEKNTLVVRQRVRIMPYDNYALVQLGMQDGGRHLTPVCKSCVEPIMNADTDTLEDIYVSDLQSLSETSTNKRDIEVVAKMHKRKPVEVI